MEIDKDYWNELRSVINEQLKEDTNLTGIMLEYHLRTPERGTENLIKLKVR